MPIPKLMRWIPSQRRWRRMYKGKQYYISARALGCAETQEASVLAANAWWKQTQATIDAARLPALPPRPLLPLEDAAASALGMEPGAFFGQLLAFWMKHKTDEAAAREAAERDVRGIIANVWQQVGQALIENQTLPDGIGERLPPARTAQIERGLKELHGESTAEPERTVQAHVKRWIANRIAQIGAGSLSADQAEYDRICLNHFAGFIGETADVNAINAERLHDFYLFCLQKLEARNEDKGGKAGWSVDYAKKIFGTARSWIRWLYEQEIIELPKNINSRAFKFGSTIKRVPTMTVDEVRFIIDAAKGKMKLALLLMVNCGFTQVDASDLLDTEVDWIGGRIIRKRSKTDSKESTPVVNYQLWPCTFALLKEHRSGQERVILTESGRPFIRKDLVNGKPIKCDSIASNYIRLKERTGKPLKPMKLLRKTSASLLESHSVYGRFTSLFLGHAPASMKDRHYAAPPQQLFDEAVTWLGQQLGFITDDAHQSH